jgi:hypothetical protein
MVIIHQSLRLPPPEQTWVQFVLPMMVCGLSAIVVIAGFFGALGHDRRALHDYLGGTVVLRAGRAPPGFVPLPARPGAAARCTTSAGIAAPAADHESRTE